MGVISLEVDVKGGEGRRVRFRSWGIEEVDLNENNGDRHDSSQWLQTSFPLTVLVASSRRGG